MIGAKGRQLKCKQSPCHYAAKFTDTAKLVNTIELSLKSAFFYQIDSISSIWQKVVYKAQWLIWLIWQIS